MGAGERTVGEGMSLFVSPEGGFCGPSDWAGMSAWLTDIFSLVLLPLVLFSSIDESAGAGILQHTNRSSVHGPKVRCSHLNRQK